MIDDWTGDEFTGDAYYFTTSNGQECVSRATFFKSLGFNDPMGIVPPNDQQAPQETTEDPNPSTSDAGVQS